MNEAISHVLYKLTDLYMLCATFPSIASSKHVSWLLGRDGDVSVCVIGQVDDFRCSKLLLNDR